MDNFIRVPKAMVVHLLKGDLYNQRSAQNYLETLFDNQYGKDALENACVGCGEPLEAHEKHERIH